MEDKLYSFIVTLVGGAFLVIGAIFGMSSLKFIIPAIIMIVVAVVIYQKTKGRLERQDYSNAIYVIIGASIIIFILVGLGNCIGSCTKGGGDTRQQRIEMGLPPY